MRALAHSISVARSAATVRLSRPAVVGARSVSSRPLRSSSVRAVRPWSAQRVRRAPQATAWKVPVVASRRRPSLRSRSSSSPAALRVKVSASTCRGSASPVATR